MIIPKIEFIKEQPKAIAESTIPFLFLALIPNIRPTPPKKYPNNAISQATIIPIIPKITDTFSELFFVIW